MGGKIIATKILGWVGEGFIILNNKSYEQTDLPELAGSEPGL